MKQIRTFGGKVEFVSEMVNKFLSTLEHGANPQILQSIYGAGIVVTVVYEAFP
jgi:hypothetical protein